MEGPMGGMLSHQVGKSTPKGCFLLQITMNRTGVMDGMVPVVTHVRVSQDTGKISHVRNKGPGVT